jgi:magnesium transporter
MRGSPRLKGKKSNLPFNKKRYVYVQPAKETKIVIIGYDEHNLDVKQAVNVAECVAAKDKFKNTWIDISGITDVEAITSICEQYDLHPLVIKDIFNVEERPKIDIFDDYSFIAMRAYYHNLDGSFSSEQISIILGRNFLITISESDNNLFGAIKERLTVEHNVIRSKGTDYLAQALIDVVVDKYYKVVEAIGDDIEAIDEDLMKSPDPKVVRAIHTLKREVILVRKSIWPLREIISGLQHNVGGMIQSDTVLYLKDVYDHTIQIMDTIETNRDFLSGMMDIYLSSVSNRMNEVMKVLTVFAAIFIPLTFITSIYGMNFNTAAGPFSMPELNWRYGYLLVWGVMIVLTVGMLVYFKRKKWW